jgi:protein TonB
VARQPQPQSQPTPLPQLAAPIESPAITAAAVPPAPTIPTPLPAAAAPAPALTASQPRFDANYLDNPKPAYPAISRRMGEEGRVVLRVRVNAEGLATDVQLHTSSGSERLDNAALTTVQRWKFVPAHLGTEAIAASVLVPIVFSLRN